MPAQQHDHPSSLVPGRKAVAHRVDSHQDLQQSPTEESPSYTPYHQEYAPHLERARKNDRRSHRILDGDIYERSFADGGIEVAGFLSGFAPAAASVAAPALKPVHTQSQASPQSSHLARPEIHHQAQADAHPSHPTRPKASSQAPSNAPPRSSTHPSSRSNTHPHPFEIPLKPLPASHIPSASSSTFTNTIALTLTPAPTTSPAIVHVHSLVEDPSILFVDDEGDVYRKDTSNRDSVNSNAFIEADQLDDDVQAPLIKYIENPRTKLEQVKNKVRGWVHW